MTQEEVQALFPGAYVFPYYSGFYDLVSVHVTLGHGAEMYFQHRRSGTWIVDSHEEFDTLAEARDAWYAHLRGEMDKHLETASRLRASVYAETEVP